MRGEEPRKRAKPFDIPMHRVEEAFRRVKQAGGGPGSDGITLERYEQRLEGNLYKVWNRMSSGSYHPKPVLGVEIAKEGGGTRLLGIPTVEDRVAQMVVLLTLEPELEEHFLPDSYAYRPGKSALEAVGAARRRCFRYDWVLDLDIKGFFDSIDHALMMRAVRAHTSQKWVHLYVERWLTAPLVRPDGSLQKRDRGTPQGGVISPLLANLFLHHAFDLWMKRTCPAIPFERYADDIVCHAKSEAQAEWLLKRVEERLRGCGLELNREKTRIVYCADDNRTGSYPHRKFDFLGYTFRPRKAKNGRGEFFIAFLPAISDGAAKRIRRVIRAWRLHRRTTATLAELARAVETVLVGWINYYGAFYRSALYEVFSSLDRALARWGMRKYKKLRRRWGRAWAWLGGIRRRQPGLFAHWRLLGAAAGR